jgi:hypothetical protein
MSRNAGRTASCAVKTTTLPAAATETMRIAAKIGRTPTSPVSYTSAA